MSLKGGERPKRANQRDDRETWPDIDGFEDKGRGSSAKEHEQPLENGKVKETDSPQELQEGTQLC